CQFVGNQLDAVSLRVPLGQPGQRLCQPQSQAAQFFGTVLESRTDAGNIAVQLALVGRQRLPQGVDGQSQHQLGVAVHGGGGLVSGNRSRGCHSCQQPRQWSAPESLRQPPDQAIRIQLLA